MVRKGSAVSTQRPRRTGSTTGIPGPAKTLDQHRVVRQRLGPVDQCIQHLVVPGRRHVEQFADGLLLGPGELPPLPLESQHFRLAGGQGLSRAGGRLDRLHRVGLLGFGVHSYGVHRSPPVPEERTHCTTRTTTVSFTASRRQAIESRIKSMSASVVSGLTTANLVTVSPSCVVGTTNA